MFQRLLFKSLVGAALGLGAFQAHNLSQRDKVLCAATHTSTPRGRPNSWLRSKNCEKLVNPDKLFLCTGNANRLLAEDIAKHLGTSLGDALVSQFSDGEINIQIRDNIRGKDVYIIQPTCPPVNQNLMELLLLISTVRRASAKRVTAVVPYYGYARQDRKMTSRVPISAADVAKLLETVGVDRVISMDLHCGQIQGFFSPRVPADNLDGSAVLLDYVIENKQIFSDPNNIAVVSPDAGGVGRARKFQERLIARGFNKTELAMIIKQRKAASQIERMDLVGSVAGKDCIVIDDIVDTAGTICEAAKELKKKGAKKVFIFASHGLFSRNAYQNIAGSCIEQIIVTNSIPLREGAPPGKITQLSVSTLLAEAIRRTAQNESVMSMFL